MEKSQAENLRAPPPNGAEYDGAKAPLDPSLYEVDFDFFSALTGIKDPEELREHILKVQAEAYAIYPYPCIRIFSISQSKINKLSAYKHLLQLAKEREGAVLLDLGCGVGNDLRRAVLDGWPVGQVIGTDLKGEFWNIGHKLFRSTAKSFPAKFLEGNIFEPDFLEYRPIATTNLEGLAPDIPSLTTLTPLIGRVSAIHASSFFHLFDEERQEHLAKLFASLLSPEPGSIILGAHCAQPEKGLLTSGWLASQKDFKTRLFCHSPESWKELWTGVFGEGKVEVWAMLKEVHRADMVKKDVDSKHWFMSWSVKRL